MLRASSENMFPGGNAYWRPTASSVFPICPATLVSRPIVLVLDPALMTRLCLGRDRVLCALCHLVFSKGKKLSMHTSQRKAGTGYRDQDHSDRRGQECFLIENSSLKPVDEVRV